MPEEPVKPQPGAIFNPAPAAPEPDAPAEPESPAEPVPAPVPVAPINPPAAPVADAPVSAPRPIVEQEPDPPERDDPRPEVVPQAPVQNSVEQPTTQASEPADAPLVSWQASEYIHHDKRFGWYAIFFVIVAGLIAVAALTHQWLTIGVFVVMAGALAMYANKPPRVLTYSLGEHGIMIETKFYPYDTFRSFGLIQDVAWHLIDLEPLKRLMPRLSIMFEDDKRDQIVAILTEFLPRHDRQPDLVERAARYLHF